VNEDVMRRGSLEPQMKRAGKAEAPPARFKREEGVKATAGAPP
jgi:hypothetical protein